MLNIPNVFHTDIFVVVGTTNLRNERAFKSSSTLRHNGQTSLVFVVFLILCLYHNVITFTIWVHSFQVNNFTDSELKKKFTH